MTPKGNKINGSIPWLSAVWGTGPAAPAGNREEGRELLDRAGWGALAQAVIFQACEDYRSVSGRLRRKPNPRTRLLAVSLERFFVSRWFETLSDLDGRKILERMKEEYR